MKGLVFNLLEDVVVRHYGEHTWERLLQAADLEGAYTSLGSYPDEEMQQLVKVAAQALEMTPFDVLRWFGRNAIPSLATRYPAYFGAHTTTRTFILSVNSIIHPEVRKVYPGANVPTFGFRDDSEGALLLSYYSARRLCALAQGFIEGAAGHFGEVVRVEHLQCMNRGDESCVCRIVFPHPGRPE